MGWAIAATASIAALATLALIGSRPDSAFVRFRPAGIMRAITPEEVSEARVTSPSRVWRYAPGAPDSSTAAVTSPTAMEALRLLHAAAPLRSLAQDELGDASLTDFGLDPPSYVVSVEAPGRPPLRVRFGATNPPGVGQYAQIDGHDDVIILPRYVGEAWERAAGIR